MQPSFCSEKKSRQHSEGGGGGGDEDFFFSGFGDLEEYGDSSDGQRGSGRDYDYFEVRLLLELFSFIFKFLSYKTLIIRSSLGETREKKNLQRFVWLWYVIFNM